MAHLGDESLSSSSALMARRHDGHEVHGIQYDNVMIIQPVHGGGIDGGFSVGSISGHLLAFKNGPFTCCVILHCVMSWYYL